MKKLIVAILIGVGALAGWFAGGSMNDYLAIEMESKNLPEWQGNPSADQAAALPLRMVDLGGVGIEADSTNWGASYSHTSDRFGAALLTEEPYVDTTAARLAYAQFDQYAKRMAGFDFNAIQFGGFLRFVDFDGVGSGFDIYPEDSPFRAKQAAARRFFQPMFQQANALGMRVYLRTDMVVVSDPLEQYLKEKGLDVEDPAFWAVYRVGLEELFDSFPEVAGIMIRVGEAGAVFNQPGYAYRSTLSVRTDASLQTMLRTFLEVAEERDREIIFRSWTVGIGEFGDLHTNPDTYQRVLGDIRSPNLVVSTKVTAGDFWSHLPVNETLFGGPHRRIVELQARREFEAFNVIPNYVAGLYQGAISAFVKANTNVEGLWVWTQGGGPLRRGPLMLYPFVGNWLWTDANVYGASRLGLNPNGNARIWARDWALDHLDLKPADADRLADLLAASHRVAAEGLTVPGFARQKVRGLGLEVPPVLYAYWDIVDGSSALGSHIHAAVRNDYAAALQETESSPTEVRRLAGMLPEAASEKWDSAMEASLEYESNLIQTLSTHKRFLLSFNRWLDTGEDRRVWQSALGDFSQSLTTHRDLHAGSLDYPAYNFDLAERSLAQARRLDVLRAAAFILGVLGLILLFRSAPTLVFFWLSAVFAVLGTFSSPVFSLVSAMTAALVVLASVAANNRDRAATGRLLAPALVPVLFLCGLMAFRGPQYVWFLMWTSDAARLFLLSLIGLSVGWRLSGIAFLKRPIRGLSILAGGLAIWLLGVGATLYAWGLEASITRLNEELLILPGMLSRVLGIVTYLEIPTDLPWFVLGAGGVVLAAALLLRLGESAWSTKVVGVGSRIKHTIML